MSLFDIFENRMKQIFEGGNAMAPLPFKKLAKMAVREMKGCSAKLDGRTVAPCLYTILVNPQDDAAIAPLYQQVTDELVDFLAHEAQNMGLVLIANPMVRFIPVADKKPGKMEVIAEIVSPDVLAQVRAEETDYLRNRMPGRPEANGALPLPEQDVPAAQPVQTAQPARPAMITLPQMESAAAPASAPLPSAPSMCSLSDSASGKTWRIGVDSTIIGRDETVSDLVLSDTNISRRHAELTRSGKGWHIADLGSTNGTRVNGMRVTEHDLVDGDTITMGLVSLSFAEVK